MGWQDAPVIKEGTPSVTPAWMLAPVANVPPAAAGPKPTGDRTFGNVLAGEGELAGSALANIPHAAAHAAVDIYRRLTGGDTNAPDPGVVRAIQVPVGQAGRDLISDTGELPAAQAIGGAAHAADRALETASPTAHDVLHQTTDVLGDAAALAPVVGAVKGIGGLLDGGLPPVTPGKAPFQTAEGHVIARNVAGGSGHEALTLANQGVGNVAAGAEAGVPHGTPLSYEALEAAREAPNAVYGRIAQSLPAGPLSPNAAAGVRAAGGAGARITEGTPDAIQNINSLKAQLLDPNRSFTGNQVVNEMRGLRQEGYVNIGSDDVSKQQLGKAQLDMSKALEAHVADTLPPGAPVTLDQLTAARQALAKNHAVQGALRGSVVDMQAIARMQRADPDLLTGGLKEIGDFANSNPEVSALPSKGVRYNPPGLAKDLSNVSIKTPQSWIQPFLGALARRAMVGPAGAAEANARAAFPGRLGNEFSEVPLTQLHAPPGTAFEPHQPDLATGAPTQPDLFGYGTGGMTASPPSAFPAPAAGGAGQFSLADLLSHGVEQRPAPGLSLAPEGVPAAPAGVPFRPNVEHMAGGLELAPEGAAAGAQPSLGDLAHAMSQGVPEGTMTRANQPRKISKRDMVDMTLQDRTAPTLAELLGQ